jgi:hypothetical protein
MRADDADHPPRDHPAWRRFAAIFLAVLFGGLGSIYVFLLVVDPYDTGRFPTFMSPGVSDEDPRSGSASRGRDPQFDAAIFGNSRGHLIDPARLSQPSGANFVQLTTAGSGPAEHMAMMRYFMARHARIQAMVLNVDERWCGHDPPLPAPLAFPFWLYRGDLEYLAHLLSTRALTAARNRIELAWGLRRPYDARGYLDYEAGRAWGFHPGPFVAPSAAVPPMQADPHFPAVEALDAVLAAVPEQTAFVIVVPPVYQATLPVPGTQVAADLPVCKAALAQRMAARPRGSFLDFMVDGPISRDPENFMDMEHYRLRVARVVEAQIVEALSPTVKSARHRD